MTNGVLVLTEHGFGKSTSLGKNEELSIEGLNPKETVIINIKGKPLPFKGWRKHYKAPISGGGNYLESTDPKQIREVITHVYANRPDIKTVVIDD